MPGRRFVRRLRGEAGGEHDERPAAFAEAGVRGSKGVAANLCSEHEPLFLTQSEVAASTSDVVERVDRKDERDMVHGCLLAKGWVCPYLYIKNLISQFPC